MCGVGADELVPGLGVDLDGDLVGIRGGGQEYGMCVWGGGGGGMSAACARICMGHRAADELMS